MDDSFFPSKTTGWSERMVMIVNRRGLHARASTRFARIAETFPGEIEVACRHSGTSNLAETEWVDGKSILGLMMLAASTGSYLIIRTCGDRAEEALNALIRLTESGFNEDF